MTAADHSFVMSTELECLTSVRGEAVASDADDPCNDWVEALFTTMAELAPTLPGTGGIFNGYGRIYVDCGHVELAMAECDSPYLLASVVARQQKIVRGAVARLRDQGIHLLLANNNHSGLLQPGCAIWGSHENYLTERHPSTFGELILPFLVTRIFGGAGGIEFPSGRFLAGVRPIRMETAIGGGTTDCRAIHSTTRDEHHMGPRPRAYRYHQILGDGHRSHYNVALQFGATALALKAVLFDRRLPDELGRIGPFEPATHWVELIRRLNVLAPPGEALRIDPLVIETQRVYWRAARRWADTVRNVPAWVGVTLRDWDETLAAFERLDRAWLAARLDAFTKYEFYSAVLDDLGQSWATLPLHRETFCELALLDHSYHEFCNPDSVFDRLERDGLLAHRVNLDVEPGQEAEPFVPETKTRARARARFIREYAGQDYLVVDWSCVHDLATDRLRTLFDPMAIVYGDWESTRPPPTAAPGPSRHLRDVLADLHRILGQDARQQEPT